MKVKLAQVVLMTNCYGRFIYLARERQMSFSLVTVDVNNKRGPNDYADAPRH